MHAYIHAVDQAELQALHAQFASLSNVPQPEGGMDRSGFSRCLGSLADGSDGTVARVFAFFDGDGTYVCVGTMRVRVGVGVVCDK